VHVIVIAGQGEKFFCAGADIGMLRSVTPGFKYNFCLHANETLSRLEQTPKLVICAINGHAVGGGLEIAMACDLRIASKNSKLGQPEINIGIIPGAGGTQRLTKLVGEGRSIELILTGNMISAEKAESWGLVNLVTEEEELEDLTMKMAKQIAGKSPFAVERAKKSVKLASNNSMVEGLRIEQELFVECFNSNDGKEGIKAFIEKRKPEFQGN